MAQSSSKNTLSTPTRKFRGMVVDSVESCAVTPSRHVNDGSTVLSAVPYPHSFGSFTLATGTSTRCNSSSTTRRTAPRLRASAGIARDYGRIHVYLRMRIQDGQETLKGDTIMPRRTAWLPRRCFHWIALGSSDSARLTIAVTTASSAQMTI